MADTNTPNIGMLLPDPGDTFNFPLHVENNLTLVDTYLGAVKCTSATRPSVTYGGQLIYETDTFRLAVNNGTTPASAATWVYVSSTVVTCTSAARPLINRVVGMLAYETDTDALIRWTGTVWHYTTQLACTSGTRPNNSAVVAGTSIYETDTRRFLISNGTPPLSASWEQKAFANFVCTSATHPSSPFQGMEIYETDTGLSAVYTGSSYYYPPQRIANTTLSASATTIVLSSIPQVFTNLRLVLRLKSQSTATSHTADNVYLQFNGIASANYNTNGIFNNQNGTIASLFGTSMTYLELGALWNSFPTSTVGAGDSVININNYADTAYAKSAFTTSFASDGGSACDIRVVGGALNAGTSTAAVTSITLGTVSGAGFAANSSVELIGE